MKNPLRNVPHPLVLEVPARPWLRALSERAGRSLRLDEIPDAALDRIAGRGFHGLWLMGVWRTGSLGRRIARDSEELRREYDRVLPGWRTDDVQGSPYSIVAYDPPEAWGGTTALDDLRRRLHERGLALVLDFVPNHVAADHPWVDEHPEHLVTGTPEDLERSPHDWYERAGANGESRVIAHGRDPFFPGWTDTAQVDVRRRGARRALIETMSAVASRCDGLRCDMAMLLLRDVFRDTWGERDGEPETEFWSDAIAEVRRDHPQITLIAEVYWGREPELQELGFDFTYDKELYDALVAQDLEKVREKTAEPESVQSRALRFLENHDERRSADVFGNRRGPAAALTYSLPGLRFFQEGQREGRLLRPPVQLARHLEEPVDPDCQAFYERLLDMLGSEALHTGRWAPQEVRGVSEHATFPESLLGNRWWTERETWVVLANLSETTVQARVPVPIADGVGDSIVVLEAFSRSRYDRSRSEARDPGLFVELPPHGVHALRFPSGPT